MSVNASSSRQLGVPYPQIVEEDYHVILSCEAGSVQIAKKHADQLNPKMAAKATEHKENGGK
jgi:phosphoribosylpyrophosphate synthetase